MDVEKALKLLERGAEEAEIYYFREAARKVDVQRWEVNTSKEGISFGYGIRAIKGKRMGFAFANVLTEELLERALKAAAIAEADEYNSLPERQEYGGESAFDRRIVELQPEEVVEAMPSLLEPCTREKVQPTTGLVLWIAREVGVWNTHGLEGKEEVTFCLASLGTVVPGKDVTGYSYAAARAYGDLDLKAVGEEAASLAARSVDPVRIESMETDVTLRPDAVTELLENALVPALSADNVQRGRSLLAKEVGKEIFAPGLTIVDDGALPGGLQSGLFDAEGVRAQRKVLVENGVLRGFLFDAYTARKAGRESTGNAERGSHATLPRIAPTNFLVEGEKGIGETFVVHGLIGAHTVNPITGDFSVETKNAFYRGKPVKKAILSGNVFELLRKVKGLGEDYRQTSAVRAPSVEFEKVRVVG